MAKCRILGARRGIAAGAAAWLVLNASAAVVGLAGFNTARALPQTGSGCAAASTHSFSTHSLAAQHGQDVRLDALIDHLYDSLKITAEHELYDSMSPEQKKTADAEFRGHLQEHAQARSAGPKEEDSHR